MIRLFRLAFVVAATVSFVMAVLPHPPRLPGDPSDKLLHIAAFALLAGLGAAAFPARTVLQLWLGLTVFGAAIEVVQAIPALNRDSDYLDFLADSVAALTAAWLARRAMARGGSSSPGPD